MNPNYYGGTDAHFPDDETGIKGSRAKIVYAEFLLRLTAAAPFWLQSNNTEGHPLRISKLNEAFLTVRELTIVGGYNRLHQEITTKGEPYHQTLTAAWVLYSEDLSAPESGLSKTSRRRIAPIKTLIGRIPSLYKARHQTGQIHAGS